MTVIKVTHKRCGDLELRVTDLVVELDPDGIAGNYVFTCTRCGEHVRREISRREKALLISCGVVYRVVGGPACITGEYVFSFIDALADDSPDAVDALWNELNRSS